MDQSTAADLTRSHGLKVVDEDTATFATSISSSIWSFSDLRALGVNQPGLWPT